MDLSQRLDEMELAIHKPLSEKEQAAQMRSTIGVFDYPPEKELEVRERVEYLKNKNDRGDDDLSLWSLTCMISSLTFWKRRTSWKSAMTLKKSEESSVSSRQ